MGAYSLFYEFVRGVLTPHTALGRTSARLQLHAPTPQVSQQGFSSVSHFVDLLRSSNTSRIMNNRALRLLDLLWNKTSPGDDGSFFLRAQVTYLVRQRSALLLPRGHKVYFHDTHLISLAVTQTRDLDDQRHKSDTVVKHDLQARRALVVGIAGWRWRPGPKHT